MAEPKAERTFRHAFGFDLLGRLRCEIKLSVRVVDLKKESQLAALPPKDKQTRAAFQPIKPLVAQKVQRENYRLEMSGPNLVVTCRRRLRVEIDLRHRVVQVDGHCAWVETDYGVRHCGYRPETTTMFPDCDPPMPQDLEGVFREDEAGLLHLRIGSENDEISAVINQAEGIVIVNNAAIKARFGGKYVLDGPGLPKSRVFAGLTQDRPANVISMLDRLGQKSNLF